MRESNFSFPSHNRAAVCISSALYDRRALDCTAALPLCNSLTHLSYLTSTSPRIREILTVDGGLERLVRVLKMFFDHNDRTAIFRWSLAFQCVVNVGVRGSEGIRNRVVEAGMVPVVISILEKYLQASDRAKTAMAIDHHHNNHHHHLTMRHHHHQTMTQVSAHTRSRSDPNSSTMSLTTIPLVQHSQARPPSINLALVNSVHDDGSLASAATPTTPSAMQTNAETTTQSQSSAEDSGDMSAASQSIPPSPTVSFTGNDHLQLVHQADTLNPPPAVSRVGFGADNLLQAQVDDSIDNVETPVVIPSRNLPLESEQGSVPPAPTMRSHPFVVANANVSAEDQEILRREDDIMLSLQLLAYLSKYSHLRANFHSAYSKNVFSVVEQFTYRTYPQDIQYWAGVIMRNACRKDEARGGVRQCAYMACGKWERYPREFAKCRRCRKAKYCSKSCQSRAWAEGHRWWCVERHPTSMHASHANESETTSALSTTTVIANSSSQSISGSSVRTQPGVPTQERHHHRNQHTGSHGASMASLTVSAVTRQEPSPALRFLQPGTEVGGTTPTTTPTAVAAATLADPTMFANTDRRHRIPPPHAATLFSHLTQQTNIVNTTNSSTTHTTQTWPRLTRGPLHQSMTSTDIVMNGEENASLDNPDDDDDVDIEMGIATEGDESHSQTSGLGMIMY